MPNPRLLVETMLRELNRRKSQSAYFEWDDLLIADILKEQGCPDEILNPLKDWLKTGTITKIDLLVWKEGS